MVQPGELLKWLHVPSDGYGYTLGVPVRFVKWAAWGTVLVDVVKADGSTFKKRIDERTLVQVSTGKRLTGMQRETVKA